MPSGTRAPESIRVEADANEELETWTAKIPLFAAHPDPATENALPPEWAVLSHLDVPNLNFFLCSRSSGGYLLLMYGAGTGFKTLIWWGSASLLDLYNEIRVSGQGYAAGRTLVTDWLTGYLVGHFDATDPTEAAEATVVALGGPMTALPKALLTNG